jgi:hypothetical protein
MIDASRILGFASVALLALAFGAWWKLWGTPKLARLDGLKGSRLAEGEFASRLLVLAAGLSAIAAVLAIAGWVRNIG